MATKNKSKSFALISSKESSFMFPVGIIYNNHRNDHVFGWIARVNTIFGLLLLISRRANISLKTNAARGKRFKKKSTLIKNDESVKRLRYRFFALLLRSHMLHSEESNILSRHCHKSSPTNGIYGFLTHNQYQMKSISDCFLYTSFLPSHALRNNDDEYTEWAQSSVSRCVL